jgi:hypothetical protein
MAWFSKSPPGTPTEQPWQPALLAGDVAEALRLGAEQMPEPLRSRLSQGLQHSLRAADDLPQAPLRALLERLGALQRHAQQALDVVENSFVEIAARSGEQLTFLGHIQGFLEDSSRSAEGLRTEIEQELDNTRGFFAEQFGDLVAAGGQPLHRRIPPTTRIPPTGRALAGPESGGPAVAVRRRRARCKQPGGALLTTRYSPR